LNLFTAAGEEIGRNNITVVKNNEENERQEKERNRDNKWRMRKIGEKK